MFSRLSVANLCFDCGLLFRRSLLIGVMIDYFYFSAEGGFCICFYFTIIFFPCVWLYRTFAGNKLPTDLYNNETCLIIKKRNKKINYLNIQKFTNLLKSKTQEKSVIQKLSQFVVQNFQPWNYTFCCFTFHRKTQLFWKQKLWTWFFASEFLSDFWIFNNFFLFF